MIKAFDEVFPGLIADEDLKKNDISNKGREDNKEQGRNKAAYFYSQPASYRKKGYMGT